MAKHDICHNFIINTLVNLELAIFVTGLGISYDYTFLQGKTYQFMAVTHAIVVILWLVWLPFGKFFHIFQRFAQLGANLYKYEGQRLHKTSFAMPSLQNSE